MEIKTNFAVGDIIYILDDTVIRKGVIIEVNVEINSYDEDPFVTFVAAVAVSERTDADPPTIKEIINGRHIQRILLNEYKNNVFNTLDELEVFLLNNIRNTNYKESKRNFIW
jgi:hypothetical protein